MNPDDIYISHVVQPTPSCYVQHCTMTIHRVVTQTSLGLHYAHELRWPIALVLTAAILLLVVALTAGRETGE